MRTVTLRELTIDDARALRGVALYNALRQSLVDDGFLFRIPAAGHALPWRRASFLNLTFWSAAEPSDVLTDDHIPADVVCHVAWHHLARKALAHGPLSADAMFLGEAIASAFDLYLIGRLLHHVPDAEFLETQVPAMTDCALEAGLSEDDVAALFESAAEDPERAFEDLRALLFDVTSTLLTARSVDDAAALLHSFSAHRFAPLLHHFEISNWILYVRAYAPDRLAPDPAVRALDASLRAAPVSLDWLESHWLPSPP